MPNAFQTQFKRAQNVLVLRAARNASSERVSESLGREQDGVYVGVAGTGHINNSLRDQE